MRAVVVLLTLALIACASSPSSVQIVGRYAPRLTGEDLQQIRVVAVGGGHLALQKVDAFEANRVRVETGTRTDFVRFILIKRKGRWATDNSPDAVAEIESGHLAY